MPEERRKVLFHLRKEQLLLAKRDEGSFHDCGIKQRAEEWEEFELMEMSKKVIEGPVRATGRGEESLLQGAASSLPGTGSP